MSKLAPSTHLYTASQAPESRLFKSYEILCALPFGGAAIKQMRRDYPKAAVTARNLPLSSEQLRDKLEVEEGSSVHIFGCVAGKEKMLIACRIPGTSL